ncbi:Putative mycofactocin system creatinine amidohydrolase family protein MftE [Capillimicrobium parvum]|uniref:Mycofactocin system creatinine amidohydrolase family protein MftE n=2 Tax=Capillimicrobium parvum TaxID=2884022 RepID=A0A9E7BYX2_9ACTN|nr:Putative mycofactocin system creatinine amidohydrolase family protein MftE [Capillimicrobium parvum]
MIEDPRPVVLLLPVGSTEPHGPHSPLATDPIISAEMCLRVARALRDDPDVQVSILPEIGYGVTRFTKAWPGAIHIEEETLLALLVDICVSLARQGLGHVVIVNNHFEPEHIKTLHRAMDEAERRTGNVVGYLDLTRKRRAEQLTDEVREGGSHAGRYETSIVLAARPGLVDEQVMAALEPMPKNLAAEIAHGAKDFVAMGLPKAYNGTPADATVDEGRQSLVTLTDMLTQQVRDLAAGTGGRDTPGLYIRV